MIELRGIEKTIKSPAGTIWGQPAFLPDGRLFVAERCCGLDRTESRLLIVQPATSTVATVVAIGFADRDHTSLSASSDGHWLTYLSGDQLFESHDGARPVAVRTGLAAVAW